MKRCSSSNLSFNPVHYHCQRLILLLFALLATIPLPALGAETPLPAVTVAVVAEANVNPAKEYVGHIEAVQSVELRARVEGFLEKIGFAEGANVRAGDLLYTIEPAPYRARVAADRAGIAQAEAMLEKAERHLKRLRAARPESIRATDLDNAVAEKNSARARLEEARASLTLSELNLSYTSIKAPIKGRLGKTSYTEGNLVNPASAPLARLVQLDPIRVVFSVSENEITAIRMILREKQSGETQFELKLRLADGSLFPLTGRIDFVDNQVDPETGTIAVRGLFANPGGLLLPGQYVTALMSLASPRLKPLVEQAAVLVDKNSSYVLVVDDQDRVVKQPITCGAVSNGCWVVESGLQAGTRVIVEGLQRVKPGQQVRALLRAQSGE